METNREKFNKIATSTNTGLLKEVAYRNANRDWLRKSKRIAVKVLMALKEQNMTQKDLAEKMKVSPQYINKIVKGGENLTIETITKLEDILGIVIFADTVKAQKTGFSTVYSGSLSELQYATTTQKYNLANYAI